VLISGKNRNIAGNSPQFSQKVAEFFPQKHKNAYEKGMIYKFTRIYYTLCEFRAKVA
jgi:hypothetical protein